MELRPSPLPFYIEYQLPVYTLLESIAFAHYRAFLGPERMDPTSPCFYDFLRQVILNATKDSMGVTYLLRAQE